MTDRLIFAAAAFFAGMLNTVAGGGTFPTFPALVYTGVSRRGGGLSRGDQDIRQRPAIEGHGSNCRRRSCRIAAASRFI